MLAKSIKYLFTFFMLVFLVGCERNKDDHGKKTHYGLQVVTINGCQYVLYINSSRGSSSMVHAGNCNNPQHKP